MDKTKKGMRSAITLYGSILIAGIWFRVMRVMLFLL